jgi:integrase
MAMPEPYRSVAAILHATGADMSQVLDVTVQDVEEASRQLQLRHGKTFYRNRAVLVMEWAWPYVLAALDRAKSGDSGPDRPLFPGVNRYTLSDHFRVACASARILDYSLRDARHSYAVEVLKAGGSPQAVARQLGHANTTLVHRVYGRYLPADAEVQEAHRKVNSRDSGAHRHRRKA